MCARTALSGRFRMWGWIPLVFFGLHFHHHWSHGQPANILWMCHVSNLILAVGWTCAWPNWIRVAALWLIPGLPIWLMDAVQAGEFAYTSALTHCGGMALGLVLLHRVRAARWTWLYALVLFLVLQQLCRLLAPEKLDVNLAHRIRGVWTGVFSAYWQYWLFTSLLALGGLWSVNKLLLCLFPPIDRHQKDAAARFDGVD